jgi:hypothetical protein
MSLLHHRIRIPVADESVVGSGNAGAAEVCSWWGGRERGREDGSGEFCGVEKSRGFGVFGYYAYDERWVHAWGLGIVDWDEMGWKLMILNM